MKKITLFLPFLISISLYAAERSSEDPYIVINPYIDPEEYVKQSHPLCDPAEAELLTKSEPALGEQWQSVAIGPDNSIYCLYEGLVQKWDFKPNQISLAAAYSCPSGSGKFSDNVCYLKTTHNQPYVMRISMKDGSKKSYEYPHIKAISSSNAGALIISKDCFRRIDNSGNEHSNPLAMPNKGQVQLKLLDSGEIILLTTTDLYMIENESDAIKPFFSSKSQTLDKRLGNKYIDYLLHKKTSNNGLVAMNETTDSTAILLITDSDNDQPFSDIATIPYLIATSDMHNDHLAIDGLDKNQLIIIDLQTGKELYHGSHGIGGTCAMRLTDNDIIYYVGNEPKLTGRIIDTREKQKEQ